MHERLERTAHAIAASGADWAILTDPGSVAYASGHVVPIEAGPSVFAGGPTTAIVGRDGTCAVVAANVEGAAAEAGFAEVTELYEGVAFETEVDPIANYRDRLEDVCRRLGVGGTVAVEQPSFPRLAAEILQGCAFVPIERELARVRAVKTVGEIAGLRKAGHVAALGQKAFMRARHAGRTELDVFAEIRAAMENAAGTRVPLTGDFISGVTRTAAFTGWPVARTIGPGDPVISDLSPRVDGIWGDSCASAMVGGASPAFRNLFDAARSALMLAGEIIRPGLAFNELDRRLRDVVAKSGHAYPHHSGHSIGFSVPEWPRIVPRETAVIAEGMVLMVEPGAYDPEIGGVRTEWMFEVTANGCRVLTDFEHAHDLPG